MSPNYTFQTPAPKRVKFSDKASPALHRLQPYASLTSSQVLKPCSPEATLLSIPTELKIIIFKDLDTSSQVYLSLTCQNLADLGRSIDLNLNVNVWWKKDKLELLKQLKTWVPDDLKLCSTCARFRFRVSDYWYANKHNFCVGKLAQSDSWAFRYCVTSWAEGRRGTFPECSKGKP